MVHHNDMIPPHKLKLGRIVQNVYDDIFEICLVMQGTTQEYQPAIRPCWEEFLPITVSQRR